MSRSHFCHQGCRLVAMIDLITLLEEATILNLGRDLLLFLRNWESFGLKTLKFRPCAPTKFKIGL